MTIATAHVIPDVLEPGLDVVFCGTAPSAASKERGAYYARPGNRFWPTRHAVGLTDVCKTAWGQDADLVPGDCDPASFRAKIALNLPRYLAFTSKRAGSEFLGRNPECGIQPETFAATQLSVLPSTSGLATRFWNESFWRDLALRLRDGS